MQAPVRIVCAPDSFKESMTALEAAEAMAEGVRRAAPDAVCVLVPMADGGEGTAQALVDALGGELVDAAAHDALGRPVTAQYGLVAGQGLAVIEVAQACGLAALRPEERDPRVTTTYGVGEVILDALDRGARRFIIGLGGTATNDAGAGMISALGGRLLDFTEHALPPGGAALAQLATAYFGDLDPRLAESTIELACDVDNPLLGRRGASAVFGPQKGADAAAVAELDAALGRWAEVVERVIGRQVRDIPGAGAAGGLGAAFLAIASPGLRRGVDLIIEAVGLADEVVGADWVFTGEGGIDAQTLSGKTPWGVARAAQVAGVPVVMFGGRIAPDAAVLLGQGVVGLVPIVRAPSTLAEALADGPANLADAAELTTRLLLAGGRVSPRP